MQSNSLQDTLRDLTITRAKREAEYPHLMSYPDDAHRMLCQRIAQVKQEMEAAAIAARKAELAERYSQAA